MDKIENLERERAFTEGASGACGAITLRPFSWGTMNLCRVLRLVTFTGTKAEREALAPERAQYELAAFAWMQSAPLDVVAEAEAAGTVEAQVKRFVWGLEIAQLPQIIAEVKTHKRAP